MNESLVDGSSRGRGAVFAMLMMAVLAATFAWWWNFNRGHRALDFYGSEGAVLVRTAPIVEFLQSAPDAPIDISKAPGLINARASLLSDASYDWFAGGVVQESPLFSVRVRSGERELVVTFDFENRTIHASTTQRTAKLNKKTAVGWQGYLARQAKVHPAEVK